MDLESLSSHQLINNTEILNFTCPQGEFPKEITRWFKSLLYTVYALTFFIGFIGNVLVCVVIKQHTRKRIIHLLTFNLAICDLIVLLVYLPMETYQLYNKLDWGLGKVMCQILYPVNSCTVNASIYTLVVITRDRYIAVKQPMAARQRQVSSINRWIFGIWVFSFALTLPLLFVVNIVEDNSVSKKYCTENWPNPKLENVYWFTIFAIQFVVPLGFIVLTYFLIIFHLQSQNASCTYQNLLARDSENAKIGERLLSNVTPAFKKAEIKLKKLRENGSGINCMELRRKRQLNKILKMIFIWVLVYCICVLPQHTVYFAKFFNDFACYKYSNYISLITNYFMIVNSSINPIIYGVLNDEIKKGAKKLLLCRGFSKYFRRLLVPLDKRFWLICLRTKTLNSNNHSNKT
ncbi:putative neuropeptide Y receptor type 6 [Hydra vulgaris]|uniref:Neuropeptide Y receptor type 6 n=1 Tax=Hydra vulgaris TaxID=6087 RepID=A0ABM4BU38_HYDVU